ncbi:hypothetical protein [Bosea sp. (in: a-proteobacteria)]|jgi:hypothetical protein|uniref:hypothetical protein n=1 Tax=Bosea sp. (in: a-proteobacteria) TaxID=1871050 RepID=UPI002732837E|nr:hypothetical protein [Bosea sp. (in: a-proteobacteria)]MDP3408161.1 hypothetical protein [Bosea sp. (in: a-proteobacteria)]
MKTMIEHPPHAGESGRVQFKLETIEDYELATRRITVLDACARSEDEERERQALIAAVGEWDRCHDDATGWTDAS